MITQSEKDVLVAKLLDKINCLGGKYAVSLKYGKCSANIEKELFAFESLLKAVNSYFVFLSNPVAIYTYKSGNLIIAGNDWSSMTFNEIVYTLTDFDFIMPTYSYVYDDTLYIISYWNGFTVTGDVEELECPICLLDIINCIPNDDMSKIYELYACDNNLVLPVI